MRADCLNLMCRCPCDENDACGRWWDLSSLGVPPRNRRACSHVSRLPESYQLGIRSTGFAGGVQPGGGIHCSRTGALGHGPLMKCGAPPPPTAGHSLFEETGGADWGAGAGGAGAAAGDGAESLFCWLTAAPRPRIATAAAPATWGSMVDGSKAAKGMVVREGPPTRPGVFGATRKPSARECTTKGATMSGSISAEGPLRSEI